MAASVIEEGVEKIEEAMAISSGVRKTGRGDLTHRHGFHQQHHLILDESPHKTKQRIIVGQRQPGCLYRPGCPRGL
jgi:hypothetical protein